MPLLYLEWVGTYNSRLLILYVTVERVIGFLLLSSQRDIVSVCLAIVRPCLKAEPRAQTWVARKYGRENECRTTSLT